ncbi:MAG: acyltransferase [Actinobacteria bacterium]|nr:acyltransferase [Actinomycetota bacterium]
MARGKDNFGALRLAAATAVLASHAFGLTGRDDPFRAIAGQTLGDAAVAVFFAISGFLVAGSWFRDPHPLRFLKRRVRRIWPGLTVAVLFTAYVVGPLFTRMPIGSYLRSGGTHGYVIAKLAMHSATNALPGVFGSNPLNNVNGSLWTLPVETKAYVLVAALGVCGVLRRRWILWPIWLLSVELVVMSNVIDIGSVLRIWPREVFLVAVFLGGVLLFRERDRVPLRAPIAVALIAAWLASTGTVMQVPLGAAGIPYACLWVAYRTRPVLTGFFERFDLSYGVYLYGYPIEQGVRAALGHAATPFVALGLAAPLTALAALGSWRFVERPWLRSTRRPDLPTVPDPAAALSPVAEAP